MRQIAPDILAAALISEVAAVSESCLIDIRATSAEFFSIRYHNIGTMFRNKNIDSE